MRKAYSGKERKENWSCKESIGGAASIIGFRRYRTMQFKVICNMIRVNISQLSY